MARAKKDWELTAGYIKAQELIAKVKDHSDQGEAVTRDCLMRELGIDHVSDFHHIKRVAWQIQAAEGSEFVLTSKKVQRDIGEGKAYFMSSDLKSLASAQHELTRLKDGTTRVESQVNRVAGYSEGATISRAVKKFKRNLDGVLADFEDLMADLAAVGVDVTVVEPNQVVTISKGTITIVA